jgi:hypothetical protein
MRTGFKPIKIVFSEPIDYLMSAAGRRFAICLDLVSARWEKTCVKLSFLAQAAFGKQHPALSQKRFKSI